MTNSYRDFAVRLVRVFIFAFLGAFLPLVIGMLAAPDLKWERAAVVSLIAASIAAGLKAVQAALTEGEAPFQTRGL